jgi:hypothetical protein
MNGITIQEIREFFERLGLRQEFYEQEPLLLWPEVAGPQMSRLTEPLRVRQGILYVETSNPVVAQQLSLMKDVYLRKLNDLLGEERILDLRFRVGRSLRPVPHPGESSAGRASEQLSLLEREKLMQLLDEVNDSKLRAAFERLMLASAKLDRARQAQGGRRCEICGVYHDDEGDVCYYCRLEGGAR